MTLIVHELGASGVIQEITTDRPVIIEGVRPHLYRHSTMAGTLTLQILSTADALIAESSAVSINSIGSLGYFHGYVRFDINAYLAADTAYKFKLVGTGGYTFSESGYVGWCNGYDLGKYDASYDELGSNANSPLDLEIWERTVK